MTKLNSDKIIFSAKTLFVFLVLAIAAVQMNVSAQTQFSELTKLRYAAGGAGNRFGNSVSIDGSTMIVGAVEFDLTATPNTTNGAAFVYVRNANGGWTLQQGLFPPLIGSNSFQFGYSVDISGETAIICAPGDKAAYIFVRNGGVWAQQARLTNASNIGFGLRCAISGNTVITTSRPDAGGGEGAVDVFVRSGTTWTRQTQLTRIAGTTGFFGEFMTIEGDTAVIGVPTDNSGGSVQVFVRSGGAWTAQQRITSVNGIGGKSVAINGDTLIAGSGGSAFVFTRSGGVWTQQQMLINPDNRPQSDFGASVALENNTAVVGSTANNIPNGGAAFVFQRSGTVWTSTQKIYGVDIRTSDGFGWSADISNSTVVIGSIGDAVGLNSGQGSAYIFVPNPTSCTFALSPTRSNLFPAAGGAGSFTVTTQAGCAWQATAQDYVSWVTTTSVGTGSGTINFNVAANAGKSRRAEITINGRQVFTFGQASGTAVQQGDFDQNFSDAGAAITSVFSRDGVAATAIQPDGKIVLVGGSTEGTAGAATVYRYNADGTLDITFDGDGIVTTTIDHSGSGFQDVAIQPDGKIVAVGSAIPVNANMYYAVARYNSNGSLDTTFGTGGIVRTDFDSPTESANAVALASDGKIIVSGTTDNNSFGIARYNTNGTLDATFDGDGKAIVSNVFLGISDMALQPDGKIVAVAKWSGTTAFLRFNTNGSLDATFDGDGRLEIPISIFNGGDAIAVQSDGKIISGGNVSGFQGATDFCLVRLNPNGTLDTTFDGDGAAAADIGLAAFSTTLLSDVVRDIVIQPNGKIVAVGDTLGNNVLGASIRHISIARFNPNGSLDTTFGRGGVNDSSVLFPYRDAVNQSSNVALQQDGKIVVAGQFSPRSNETDVMVLRFLGEGTVSLRRAPFDYDGDGKTDLSIFRPAPGEWWYLRSSDGGNRAFQFGSSADKIVPADYTGDGKTDIAFWKPSTGQWFILRSEDSSFYAFPFGASGDVPVPADYDGDGKADAAVFRESSLTWFINKSSGGTDIIGFGAAGDKPTVADYDGDGKADIAIYRPNGATGGEWWIRRSSNGSVFALQFGNSTDKPVQGDYTGDGKADVALWRPSNGNWYILRSEDFSFYAFPFGATGDVPVAGDYDGDGRFDAGVFRPSSTNWFVQRSTAGILIQQFGISGDLPTPSAFVP